MSSPLDAVVALLSPHRSDSERIAGLVLAPRVLSPSLNVNLKSNSSSKSESVDLSLAGLRGVLSALCLAGDDFLDRLLFHYLGFGDVIDENDDDDYGDSEDDDSDEEHVGGKRAREAAVFVSVALKLLAMAVSVASSARQKAVDGGDGGGGRSVSDSDGNVDGISDGDGGGGGGIPPDSDERLAFADWLEMPPVRKMLLRKVRFAWVAAARFYPMSPADVVRNDAEMFSLDASESPLSLVLSFLAGAVELWPDAADYIRRSAPRGDWCSALAAIAARLRQFHEHNSLPTEQGETVHNRTLDGSGALLLSCAGLHMSFSACVADVQGSAGQLHDCVNCYGLVKSVFAAAFQSPSQSFQVDVLRMASVLVSLRCRAAGPSSKLPGDWADEARSWLAAILRSRHAGELQLRRALDVIATILDTLSAHDEPGSIRNELTWLLGSLSPGGEPAFLLSILARVQVEVYVALDHSCARPHASVEAVHVLQTCGRLFSRIACFLHEIGGQQESSSPSQSWRSFESAVPLPAILRLRDAMLNICGLLLDYLEVIQVDEIDDGFLCLVPPLCEVMLDVRGDADRGAVDRFGPGVPTGESLRLRCIKNSRILAMIAQAPASIPTVRLRILALLADLAEPFEYASLLLEEVGQLSSLLQLANHSDAEARFLATLLLNLGNATSQDMTLRGMMAAVFPPSRCKTFLEAISVTRLSPQSSVPLALAGLVLLANFDASDCCSQVEMFIDHCVSILCEHGSLDDIKEAIFLIDDATPVLAACCRQPSTAAAFGRLFGRIQSMEDLFDTASRSQFRMLLGNFPTRPSLLF